MIDPKVIQALTQINQGVEIASELAQVAAPFVALAFPAEGALMAQIAPLASSILVKEGQIIANVNKDMTPEQLQAALAASKSANWPVPAPITPQQ